MKAGRTTSKRTPEQRRRSGHTYRKLSLKMKRRLRREKKKGACEHYRTRSPNPQVAEAAAAAGMSRAQYVERKSREQSLYKEDRVSRSSLISLLEQTMESEGRREYGKEQDLEAMYNEEIGEVELFVFRTVVDEVSNQVLEISLDMAREEDPGCRVGDSIGIKVGDCIDFAKLVDVAEAERSIKPQLVFASIKGSEDVYTECTQNNARVILEAAAWYYV